MSAERRGFLKLACNSGCHVEVSTDIKRIYVNAGATMTVDEARNLGETLIFAADQVARGWGLAPLAALPGTGTKPDGDEQS